MTLNSSRGRIALVATVVGALVAGAAGTAPAVGAPARDPRPDALATFAKQTLHGTGSALVHAAEDPSAASATKEPLSISPVGGLPCSSPHVAGRHVARGRPGLLQPRSHRDADPGPQSPHLGTRCGRDVLHGQRASASEVPSPPSRRRWRAPAPSYDDRVHNPMGTVAYYGQRRRRRDDDVLPPHRRPATGR